MKIGFISDVHSNFDALECVMNYANTELDKLICLGDIVDYYDKPQECCDALRLNKIPTVIGNHDQYLLNLQQYNKNREEIYRIDWNRNLVSLTNQKWLSDLPKEIRFTVDNWDFVCRHASPWDIKTYIYKDSALISNIVPKKREVLLFGHTHHKFSIRRNEGWIINAGSVGQPRSGEAGADLTVFDTEKGFPEQLRLQYDVKNMQKRLRSLFWPDILVEKIGNPSIRNA